MLNTRVFISIFAVVMTVLAAGVVYGQNYPNKPIRIIAGGVGGGNDFVSRIIAQGISGPLGQPVIVENRSSGLIQAETVSKALPDGYTMLISGSSFFILTLLQKAPYDPVRDFAPITTTDRSCNVLVVLPSLPVKSVKELIALAKAKPGALNYGSAGPGGPDQLAGELFNSMAGVKLVNIRYSGSGLAFNALLGGEVQLYFGSATVVLPQIKAGKLVALGVTSSEPSVQAPGVPPIADTLPGYEALSFTGVYAPAKTPEAIINRLNQEIVRLLNTPELKERFFNAGIDAIGSSPEGLAAQVKSNLTKWDKVIKDAGIKLN